MMLKTDSILEQIHSIQNDRKSGRLKLQKGDGEITLHFQEGLMDGARSNIAALHIGKILAEKGSLQASELMRLLEKARKKKLILGQAAVEQKILENPELKDSVREQIIRTILHALDHKFEVNAFSDGADNLFSPARFSFDRLMLELARRNLKPFKFDPRHQIGLNNGQSLAHFPWYPQELAVLGHLKTPCTVPELSTSTGIDVPVLDKILSVFDTLNLVNRTVAAPQEHEAEAPSQRYPLQYLVPEIDATVLSEKLETFHNATSFISEQFKTLKVRIGDLSAGKHLQVIAVSSPQPEDGKSTVCANLAVSFSKDPNRRTIVVDCDLRNPSQHKILGISNDPGVLGWFENDKLQPYCYMRRLGNLFLLTAGGIAANPIELLSSPRMQELLEYLKTEFHTIILDCPPFGPISDVQVLNAMADGMVMVVRRGKTSFGSLEKACKSLDQEKLIGVVFNDVKSMLFNTQYDHRYYHYQGYYPYRPGKSPRRSKTYLE